MLKSRRNWWTCGYEPVCIAGYWTFMPIFCGESKGSKKAISHRRKSR